MAFTPPALPSAQPQAEKEEAAPEPKMKEDIAPGTSIFMKSDLRTQAAHERVFHISANGSPLADSGDIALGPGHPWEKK